MADRVLMIIVGVVLIAASALARGISYGMAPHREKPTYPITHAVRIVLLSIGLLSCASGLVGLLRR